MSETDSDDEFLPELENSYNLSKEFSNKEINVDTKKEEFKIIPQIMKQLLESRRKYKEMLKSNDDSSNDPIQKAILKNRNDFIKLCARSALGW
jgi:DNA polymerase elongation subunit (family B)